MAENTEELLTAKKVSELIGFSEAKVKKAIQEMSIEPAHSRGKCNYYKPEDAEKIKTALSK